MPAERRVQPRDDPAGHAPQGGVQHAGVLPLQHTDRADVAAEAHRGVRPENLGDDPGGPALVLVRDRRENAGDGAGVRRLRQAVQEPPQLVLVERHVLAPVELEAAVHNDLAHRHDPPQVGGPGRQRAHGLGGGPRDADDRHGVQVAALQDGVGCVRGAEHHVGDVARRHLAPGQQQSHGGRQTLVDVRSRGGLDLGDHLQGVVEQDGVGVGATHVHADAVVTAHAAPPAGGSRSRSRRLAGRRSPGPLGCARRRRWAGR